MKKLKTALPLFSVVRIAFVYCSHIGKGEFGH